MAFDGAVGGSNSTPVVCLFLVSWWDISSWSDLLQVWPWRGGNDYLSEEAEVPLRISPHL